MTNRFSSGLLVLVLAVAAAAAAETPPFKITTQRETDRVEVKTEKDQALFAVHSPFGISRAVIERRGEAWPASIVLRLHLQGMENFQITHDKLKLAASVSSQNGQVRLWQDGHEDSPLDAKSPYWMDIRLIGKDGKPSRTIPLKDGYIEVPLPKAFFEGNPKSITLNWIDFYRN